MREASIATLLGASEAQERIRGLKLIQEQAITLPIEYLDSAAQLVADADNDCRWQAMIAVGEFISRDPMRVWEVARRFGESNDEDMRDAVATVLLEHLLGADFDVFFDLVRNEIDGGRVMLLDTLERCWPFDDAKHRWNEVIAYLRSKGIESPSLWETDTHP